MLFARISLPLVALLPLSATAAVLKELTKGVVPENEDGSLPLFQFGPVDAAVPSAAVNAGRSLPGRSSGPVEHDRPARHGCAARRPSRSNEGTPTLSPNPDSTDDLAAGARPTGPRGDTGFRHAGLSDKPTPTPSSDTESADDQPNASRPTPIPSSDTDSAIDPPNLSRPTPAPSSDTDSADDQPNVSRPTAVGEGPGIGRPSPTPSDESSAPQPERPTPTDSDSDTAESEDADPKPSKTSECTDTGGGFLNGMLDPLPDSDSQRC